MYIYYYIYIFQVQGKDPSVDFTQDIVEESEDERCFDEISDSVPAIDLPPCEIGKYQGDLQYKDIEELPPVAEI